MIVATTIKGSFLSLYHRIMPFLAVLDHFSLIRPYIISFDDTCSQKRYKSSV